MEPRTYIPAYRHFTDLPFSHLNRHNLLRLGVQATSLSEGSLATMRNDTVSPSN